MYPECYIGTNYDFNVFTEGSVQYDAANIESGWNELEDGDRNLFWQEMKPCIESESERLVAMRDGVYEIPTPRPTSDIEEIVEAEVAPPSSGPVQPTNTPGSVITLVLPTVTPLPATVIVATSTPVAIDKTSEEVQYNICLLYTSPSPRDS